MFHLKKFTCSVLATLAIGNSVLSLPADTSNMSNNVVNAMAVFEETPLEYAICTKAMNTRVDHYTKKGTKDVKQGPRIPAGSIIDLTEVRKENIWYNPNNKNVIWVTHFYVTDAKTRYVDYYDYWVCISNSNIVVPNYISKNKQFSIFSKPDTKSSKTNIEAYNLDGRPPLNVQRINNDKWGKVSYYELKTNKITTGYVLMADLEKLYLKRHRFDYVWYKDALYD